MDASSPELVRGRLLAAYDGVNEFHATSTNADNWNAQGFRLASPSRVERVGVLLDEVVGNPGGLVLEIREDVAGEPGAVALARTAEVEGPEAGWVVIDLGSRLTIPAGTTFWLVARSTLGGNGNSFELTHDNAGTYPKGSNSYSYDAGSDWTPRPGTDLAFRIFGKSL